MAFAAFSVGMGIAWLVIFAPQVLEGGASGWRVALVLAVPVGWACFAVAYAMGARAQRREEPVVR